MPKIPLIAVVAMIGASGTPVAAQTLAGVRIENTATLKYADPNKTYNLNSNTVATSVVEVVDVSLTAQAPQLKVHAGDHDRALGFLLRNPGNARQAFALQLAPAPKGDFQPSAIRIAVDAVGDGAFDPARDTTYVPGSGDPVLAPGGSLVVWVVSDMPAQAAEGATAVIGLTATARTGSGAPGALLAGRGEAGADALVGRTGGTAAATAAYVVGAAPVPVELVKSQSVRDPAGGARAVPGAIVTYTLKARFDGSAPVSAAVVGDRIPTGSTYVPGSLQLDGAALSDMADGDAGRVDADGVSVSLGDVVAAGERTVTFQVRINPTGAPS